MMNLAKLQNTLPFPAPRLVKLREAERLLHDCFPDGSRPSRNTIIEWIEDGTLNGKQIGRGRNYYIFDDSLRQFIQRVLDRSVLKVA